CTRRRRNTSFSRDWSSDVCSSDLTPRIQLEGTRAVDGAYLLKKIDARGQGLILTGSGGRSITGGLNFRGNADITDVSRIRPGATDRNSGVKVKTDSLIYRLIQRKR